MEGEVSRLKISYKEAYIFKYSIARQQRLVHLLAKARLD